MSTEALTGQKIAEARLEGWTFLLSYGQGGLQTRIHTEGFAVGLKIVNAIGAAAEELIMRSSTCALPGSMFGCPVAGVVA